MQKRWRGDAPNNITAEPKPLGPSFSALSLSAVDVDASGLVDFEINELDAESIIQSILSDSVGSRAEQIGHAVGSVQNANDVHCRDQPAEEEEWAVVQPKGRRKKPPR